MIDISHHITKWSGSHKMTCVHNKYYYYYIYIFIRSSNHSIVKQKKLQLQANTVISMTDVIQRLTLFDSESPTNNSSWGTSTMANDFAYYDRCLQFRGLTVCLSVCLSVCHIRALCWNRRRYRHEFLHTTAPSFSHILSKFDLLAKNVFACKLQYLFVVNAIRLNFIELPCSLFLCHALWHPCICCGGSRSQGLEPIVGSALLLLLLNAAQKHKPETRVYRWFKHGFRVCRNVQFYPAFLIPGLHSLLLVLFYREHL